MIYTEIFKLKKLLEEADIPFEFTDDVFEMAYLKSAFEMLGRLDEYNKKFPAYRIVLYSKADPQTRLGDAIEHCLSYGHDQDLLEIMGCLTIEEYSEDQVVGRLTAEEVFKRFKYCYEHDTTIYKED